MNDRLRLSCIVPTTGHSPYLQSCIDALDSAHGNLEVILALAEGSDISSVDISRVSKVVSVPAGAGFAGACNRGLLAAGREYVALVNDDALVDASWAETLLNVLDGCPQTSAIQGTNLQLKNSNVVDGCGIAWNRKWQAIQVGHGARSPKDTQTREIFGVSGTASVFRRQVLEDTRLDKNQYFDSALGTYYEDVELACRLRGRGYRALYHPEARVRHAGGTSSSGNPKWRWSQIYGNRVLVLARLWGRRFPSLLPGLVASDLLDVVKAGLGLDPDLLLGIVQGWSRAATLFSAFGHSGDPLLALPLLQRFQVSIAQDKSTP